MQFQPVSNTAKMHALETLFSNIFSGVPILSKVKMHALETLFSFFFCSSKSFQIPSECMFQRPCFQNVLCSSKYRPNVSFRDIVFIFFSAVPTRFKYRQNACDRDHVFKMFYAVPNTVRMHALEALFSFFLSCSKSFEILSEYMKI